MNQHDVHTIMNRIASFDPTKPATAERVEAWGELLGDIDYPDAERAVRAHFANSSDELTLALLRKGAKTFASLRIEQEEAAAGKTRTDCGRPKCVCTHTSCEAGWIDVETIDQRGISYDQVKACGVCRGDVAAVAELANNRAHFQTMIRDLEKREEAASATAWN